MRRIGQVQDERGLTRRLTMRDAVEVLHLLVILVALASALCLPALVGGFLR